MKTWLICYAAPGRYPPEAVYGLQKRTCDSAFEAGIDEVIPFRFEHLDPQFVERNSWLFQCARGAGYWVWKPHLALKMLESPEVNEGDIIIYCDSKIYFTKPIKELINVFQRDSLSFMSFRQIHPSKEWTKRDAFVLTNSDEPKYINTTQRVGGFYLFKKDDFAHNFFECMLKFHQDPRIISDIPNECGLPNFDGFMEHRHCESLISILSKKFSIYPYRFPRASHTALELDATKGLFTDESFQDYMKCGANRGSPPWISTFKQWPDIVTDEKSTYEDCIDY